MNTNIIDNAIHKTTKLRIMFARDGNMRYSNVLGEIESLLFKLYEGNNSVARDLFLSPPPPFIQDEPEIIITDFRLAERRKSAGLKQQDVAKMIGITRDKLSALERNKRKHPEPHVIRKLDKIYQRMGA